MQATILTRLARGNVSPDALAPGSKTRYLIIKDLLHHTKLDITFDGGPAVNMAIQKAFGDKAKSLLEEVKRWGVLVLVPGGSELSGRQLYGWNKMILDKWRTVQDVEDFITWQRGERRAAYENPTTIQTRGPQPEELQTPRLPQQSSGGEEARYEHRISTSPYTPPGFSRNELVLYQEADANLARTMASLGLSSSSPLSSPHATPSKQLGASRRASSSTTEKLADVLAIASEMQMKRPSLRPMNLAPDQNASMSCAARNDGLGTGPHKSLAASRWNVGPAVGDRALFAPTSPTSPQISRNWASSSMKKAQGLQHETTSASRPTTPTMASRDGSETRPNVQIRCKTAQIGTSLQPCLPDMNFHGSSSGSAPKTTDKGKSRETEANTTAPIFSSIPAISTEAATPTMAASGSAERKHLDLADWIAAGRPHALLGQLSVVEAEAWWAEVWNIERQLDVAVKQKRRDAALAMWETQ